MRGLTVVVGLALVLTACYMRGAAGAGITSDFASEWGCDYPAVQLAADSMKGKTATDRLPKAGWTACDVMAAVGMPDSVALSSGSTGPAATWCYQNHAGAVARQVLLRKKDPLWIVEAATRWHEMSLAKC